jgi:hypothetical protein
MLRIAAEKEASPDINGSLLGILERLLGENGHVGPARLNRWTCHRFQHLHSIPVVRSDGRPLIPRNYRIAESPSRRIAEAPNRRIAESPNCQIAEALILAESRGTAESRFGAIRRSPAIRRDSDNPARNYRQFTATVTRNRRLPGRCGTGHARPAFKLSPTFKVMTDVDRECLRIADTVPRAL